MKDSIIKFRSFLLAHIKNPSLQTLIKGLISYEMLTYVFFGIGTAIVDYLVFTFFNTGKVSALIANIISTFCAIIFSYVTNKRWVFKSKTSGFMEVLHEFLRFARARIATLIMSEVIIFASVAIYGNNQKVNQISKLISMVLTVILNYIISKLFIFNDRKELINENK